MKQNTVLSGVMGRDLITVFIHTRWTRVKHLKKKDLSNACEQVSQVEACVADLNLPAR